MMAKSTVAQLTAADATAGRLAEPGSLYQQAVTDSSFITGLTCSSACRSGQQ
jgi:hypothetical protein